jgi:hypothetical protein
MCGINLCCHWYVVCVVLEGHAVEHVYVCIYDFAVRGNDSGVCKQDADKHRRLKIIMSDRPDLINSEMGGVAFSSIDQCFKQNDLKKMFTINIQFTISSGTPFFVTVDPAAGGENSDFAIVSFTVRHGLYKVLHFPIFFGVHACARRENDFLLNTTSRDYHQLFDFSIHTVY